MGKEEDRKMKEGGKTICMFSCYLCKFQIERYVFFYVKEKSIINDKDDRVN